MTTATETEVVEAPADEDEVCNTVWWKAPHIIDFICQNPATHEVHGHSGNGGTGPCDDDACGTMCERCINAALLIKCVVHDAPVIRSYSRIK